MDPIVGTYLLYLMLSITMTVVVARALSAQGRAYLTDVFGDNTKLAESVSQLLVIGFYLVSLGFVALWLSTDSTVTTMREMVEVLSVKLGTVALVLGVMHLVNIVAFSRIRRRAREERAAAVTGQPARFGFPVPAGR